MMHYHAGKEHVARFPVSTQEYVRGKEEARAQALDRVASRRREFMAWAVERELREERGAPGWYVQVAALESSIAEAEMRVAMDFARECEARIDLILHAERSGEIKALIDEAHARMNVESEKIWVQSETIRELWSKKRERPYKAMGGWDD